MACHLQTVKLLARRWPVHVRLAADPCTQPACLRRRPASLRRPALASNRASLSSAVRPPPIHRLTAASDYRLKTKGETSMPSVTCCLPSITIPSSALPLIIVPFIDGGIWVEKNVVGAVDVVGLVRIDLNGVASKNQGSTMLPSGSPIAVDGFSWPTKTLLGRREWRRLVMGFAGSEGAYRRRQPSGIRSPMRCHRIRRSDGSHGCRHRRC
ncbi:hypothetical protein ACLOJK_038728 [Asimina triloba]